MDPASRKVTEYIDRNKNRILDFLCEFVSKKSINHGTPGTGDELEAQNWVRERFQEMGYDEVDYWFPDEAQKRPNVAGILKGKMGGRSLILQGHVDVV
ncbi:hypothetical protein LCGC14_2610010, partial [marine sediment metagenome]